MGRPARHEIEKFANDAYGVASDRIVREYSEKKNQVLADARLTGNGGAYLPALIEWGTARLREMILALADAYVEAFTVHHTPSDLASETALQTEGRKMAAGTIYGTREDLKLRSVRVRIAEEGRGIPWHLEIERAMNTALKEGLLRLKQQRIKFRDSGSALQRAEHNAGNLGRTETQGPGRNPHSSAPSDAGPQFAVIRPWSGSGDQPPAHQFPRLEALDGFIVRWMYHPTKPAVMVFSAKQVAEMGPEWSEQYIHQEYPRVKYHWTKPSITVNNAEEEMALGGGWANSPTAFDPYRGARPARIGPHDPCKWLDQWSAQGLSSDHRTKIKAQLLWAEATFERFHDPDTGLLAAMRQAFIGIAQVLFDSETLTEEVLRRDIPLLVWDSAVAAGWWRLASESPQDIFPEQLGHYWVWRDESRDWNGLFRAETAEWRARLLEKLSPSPAVANPVPPSTPLESLPSAPTNEARDDAERLLAGKTEVDKHRAAKYLDCTSDHVLRLARLGRIKVSNTRPKKFNSESLRPLL